MTLVMVLLVQMLPKQTLGLGKGDAEWASALNACGKLYEIFGGCFGTWCNQYAWSTDECTPSLKSLHF